MAGFLWINPDHEMIEVGYLHYSKFLKKSHAATEAMYLMMSYVFDELYYRNVAGYREYFIFSIPAMVRLV